MKEEKKLVAIHGNANGECDLLCEVKYVTIPTFNKLFNEQYVAKAEETRKYKDLKEQVSYLQAEIKYLKQEIKTLKGEEDEESI